MSMLIHLGVTRRKFSDDVCFILHCQETLSSWGSFPNKEGDERCVWTELQQDWKRNNYSYSMDWTRQQLSSMGWMQMITNEIFFFFFLPAPEEAASLPLQTCLQPFCVEQVIYPRAEVYFLTRACAWPWNSPARGCQQKEPESSFGVLMLFQGAFISPLSGLCLCKHKELKRLYLVLHGSASLLVSSEGGAGSQSHQSWFCSEFVTEVLLCCNWMLIQSLWIVNAVHWSLISDRNHQKPPIFVSVAWIYLVGWEKEWAILYLRMEIWWASVYIRVLRPVKHWQFSQI